VTQQLINRHERLVEMQKELQRAHAIRFVGKPLYTTLELAIQVKNQEYEELLVREFQVDYHKYIELKINTLARTKLFEELREFADSDFLQLEARVAIFDGIDESVNTIKSRLLTFIDGSLTHPPTGFEPFADACLRNGNAGEGKYYLERIVNNTFKVNFLLEIP
jgi:hypothetical protein